jgi:IS4 transposase
MTARRARRLCGHALTPGLDQAVCWTPSRHDQADPGLDRQPVHGRLLVLVVRRAGFRDEWFYLFTTLTDPALYPAEELLALYGVRWHVELNLRYLKAQMNLEQLEVKSARLVLQQWYAGLLAYNLVRGVMLWAGAAAGRSPLQLSFAQTRRLVIAAVRHWQQGGEPS